MTPEDICSDFNEWPDSWEGVEEDLPYGKGLLDVMRPFVESLIASGLAKNTVRKHMNNLWQLGGAIIREVSMDEAYDTPAEEYLRDSVCEEGGPYCKHIYADTEQRSYDATCRKLDKFFKI